MENRSKSLGHFMSPEGALWYLNIKTCSPYLYSWNVGMEEEWIDKFICTCEIQLKVGDPSTDSEVFQFYRGRGATIQEAVDQATSLIPHDVRPKVV